MKNLYKFCLLVVCSILVTGSAFAQDPDTVKISQLTNYDTALESQTDIVDQPLLGVEVYFEAVVVSYPKNSGLATPDDGAGSNEPGRIHLFVTDVNAVADGRDGMSMQLVVEGAERTTLEGLDIGDVIGVTGDMGNFGNNIQFNATDVVLLGSVALDPQYTDLAPLLEPRTVTLSEINVASETEGLYKWNAANYAKYVHSYVKLEGLEVINSQIDDDGRPWLFLSDGESVILTSDMSLRYRNDRGTYAYDPTNEDNPVSLGYNYRRLDASLDGPYTPPAPGSVVDISGYIVQNTFDPTNSDESGVQSTLKIAPWEDGIRWTADGDDPADRVTTGIPNDLNVVGFAPILDQFTATPDSGVSNSDEVALSVDVLLPNDTYTLKSVKIAYESYAYTATSGDTTVTDMTAAGGDTYTFDFGTYADFTTVNYTITATAETATGVETNARLNGSFVVESATQAAPVVFSPASGTYENQVVVSMSSVTPDAMIYYTTDGSEPTSTSTLYEGAVTLDQTGETTVVKAIATKENMTDSPVTMASYQIDLVAESYSTLAAIREVSQGETVLYNGEATVTYTRSSRNQKYMQDASAGILIDDSPGTITSTYAAGDVMTGLLGTLGEFSGVIQYVPAADPGAPVSTGEVVPVELSLDEVDLSYESMLVRFEGVTFEETGVFEDRENYSITDGNGTSVTFRTNFSESDYIGTDIPTGPINLVALVGNFRGSLQLISRDLNDFEMSTSNENGDNPFTFGLEQNYPNPFNPTTVINYSVADISNVKLEVFDVLGRKVATLVNQVKSPGSYTANFNASSISSGIYFYRLEAGDFTSIKKMMLIK
jgi:hypothetical protein